MSGLKFCLLLLVIVLSVQRHCAWVIQDEKSDGKINIVEGSDTSKDKGEKDSVINIKIILNNNHKDEDRKESSNAIPETMSQDDAEAASENGWYPDIRR